MNAIAFRSLLAVIVSLVGFAFFASAADASNNEKKLIASDNAANDRFGYSVAVSGTKAIIGSVFNDINGIDSGAAYLFDATSGSQLFKLNASDGVSQDYFGTAVGISGNTIIVGAIGDDDKGSQSGSAYLFSSTTGNQLRKLAAGDGTADDLFGSSVAINGNYAVVGARGDNPKGSGSGSAYVFDAITGNQLWKLTASDGSPNDEFGLSVSVSGKYALIGAPGDNPKGSSSGSAYLFDVTTGQQLQKFVPSDGSAFNQFGYSVSIDGNLAVMGSPYNTVRGHSDAGAAYVFDATTGAQLLKLTANDAADVDEFGFVSISGDLVLVGAILDDLNGSAYLFDANTGTQLQKFTASDILPGSNAQFGYAVGISDGLSVVGAWAHNNTAGAAYVFVPEPSGIISVGLALASIASATRRNRMIYGRRANSSC